MSAHRLTFISLPVEAMEALLAGSVRDASRWAGIELTPFIQAECWLWQIRSEQIRRNVGVQPHMSDGVRPDVSVPAR